MIKGLNPFNPYSFMPAQAGDVAAEVDHVFAFIYYICLFFFILIIGLMCIFVVKYVRKDPAKPTPHHSHSTLLELSWSVPPIILIIIMFMWGFTTYMKMRVPENNAITIYVTAKKWAWDFEYADGTRVPGEFAVPVDQPVKLVMTSQDVIHSFYLKDLRQKQDVLPNQYSTLPFTATEVGEYTVQCTEYCGDSHWNMRAIMHVLPQEEYEQWVLTGGLDESEFTLPQLGEKMFTRAGCITCHSVDGSDNTCPTFKGQWGLERNVVMPDGSTQSVTLDEAYFMESINEPNAKVREGYVAQMSSYEGQFTERQLNGLIEYLKSLN